MYSWTEWKIDRSDEYIKCRLDILERRVYWGHESLLTNDWWLSRYEDCLEGEDV